MRYALFAGDDYYPLGGFEDYKASADTQTELVNAVTKWYEQNEDGVRQWAHIVDMEERRIVLQWSSRDNEWEVL